jgi:DNA-directed RNA polymerase specialized sigma24 family protein
MMRLMRGRRSREPAPGESTFAERFDAPYRVAYRLLGDAAAASAIAREALAHADSSLFKRSPRSAAGHACRRAAALALHDELWFDRRRCPAGGTGFGEIPHRDQRRELRTSVRMLNGRRRAAFILQHLADWPVDDVAAELGLSPEALARHSSRAMESVSAHAAARGNLLQLGGSR